MKHFIVILFCIVISPVLLSHEGHNDMPGTAKSLHGGVVQIGKEINLEIIISGNNITLYPTSHSSKDIPLNEVKIEAIAKPKKGKPYAVILNPAKKLGLKATVDLNGANRLPVEITTTHAGKTDRFLIQVEE